MENFVKISEQKHTVPLARYAGGPHGLGDPDDNSLSAIEVELIIPKKIRCTAKSEKCSQEVQEYKECCKENNRVMLMKCQKQYEKLRECVTRWYEDEEFKEQCKNEYLKERSEYRRTGLPVNQKEGLNSST